MKESKVVTGKKKGREGNKGERRRESRARNCASSKAPLTQPPFSRPTLPQAFPLIFTLSLSLSSIISLPHDPSRASILPPRQLNKRNKPRLLLSNPPLEFPNQLRDPRPLGRNRILDLLQRRETQPTRSRSSGFFSLRTLRPAAGCLGRRGARVARAVAACGRRGRAVFEADFGPAAGACAGGVRFAAGAVAAGGVRAGGFAGFACFCCLFGRKGG